MKTHLFLGLLLFSTIAHAQTEKGRGLLSGNVSFNVSRQNQSGYQLNQHVTTYTPSVYVERGVFVKDNWLIGGGLGLNGGFNAYNPDNSTKAYSYGTNLAGYVRRYWAIDRFWLFLGGGLKGSYYHSHTKNGSVVDQTTNELNGDSYSVQAFTEVGAMLPITNRVALEMSTQSDAFPLSFSGFSIGLTLLTGAPKLAENLPTADAYQTQAGRWVLGGGIGLTNAVTKATTSSNTDKGSNTSFEFAPTIGKFVRKNKLVGVSIPLTIAKSDISGGGSVTTTSLGISPYIKSYLTDGQLRPFIKGDVSFINFWANSEELNQSPNNWKAQAYGAGVSMGLAYMLGKRSIVEAQLGRINGNYIHSGTANSSWTVNANATLLPGFTVNYVLH